MPRRISVKMVTDSAKSDSDREKETPDDGPLPGEALSNEAVSEGHVSEGPVAEGPVAEGYSVKEQVGDLQAESKFSGVTDRREPRGFWRRLLQLNDSPESIALGAAVGMFVAWTPTVGMQMVMILILATVIPMNRIAAFIMIYISNPLTMVPMYYLNYVLGTILLGSEVLTYDAFLQLLNTTLEIAEKESFWLATKTFMEQLGLRMLTALFVGGGFIGLLTAIPTYPLTLRWVRRYRELRSAPKRAVTEVQDGREE